MSIHTDKSARIYAFQTERGVFTYDIPAGYALGDGLEIAQAIHADRNRPEVQNWRIQR